MKILIVHNRYQQAGGEDTAVAAEMELLAQAGHTVELLEFDNAEVVGGLAKARLIYQSIYNPTAAQQLREVAARLRPDVVHVHNLFYLASPAILLEAHRLGLPVVATLHNYRLVCASALLARDGHVCELCLHQNFPTSGIRYACHRGSRVATAQLTAITGLHKAAGTYNRCVGRWLALTAFQRDKLIQSSLAPDPIHITVKPNHVPDLGFTTPEMRSGRFLYVGRLTPEKGVTTLLAAVVASGIGVDIVGGGPMEAEVRQAAASHPGIVYHGYEPRARILERMASARALLFPSTWYEGLPFTILEAYATGMPVLASDIGNLNQIVLDGQSGLTFAPGSPTALTQAMTRLDASPTLYEMLCQGARAQYEAHYTPTASLHGLEAAYKAVMELKVVS